MLKNVTIGFAAVALTLFCATRNAQRYAFQNYGQHEGLKNLSSRYIVQDSHGLLWIGTEDGVFRFDGSGFQTIFLADQADTYITGLTQDGAGRIWVSTSHALYDYDDAGPHLFDSPQDDLEFDLNAGLASDPDNAGRIYFVSRHHLFTATEHGQNNWRLTTYVDPTLRAKRPELENISFVYAARGTTMVWVRERPMSQLDGDGSLIRQGRGCPRRKVASNARRPAWRNLGAWRI